MLTGARAVEGPAVPVPVPSGSVLRVLLVEDDDQDAMLVEDTIDLVRPGQSVQLELLRERRIGDALARLEAERVDCVLLDLGLPDAVELDGLERLRRAHPRLAVVVLTGHADAHRGLLAVAAGAQDYLVKGSVEGEVLVRSVRYAVERSRAEESSRALREANLLAAENSRLERGLLPRPLVGDAAVRWTVAYRPGRRRALLGGDFYDLVACGDGWVRGVVGDVSGHGPDEAAIGVLLRVAWRTLVLARTPDAEVLPAVQGVLEAERPSDEVFATVAAVAIQPEERRLRLWLAGHPPVVLGGADGGGSRLVDSAARGPALGLLPGNWWQPEEHVLPEDWSLLLYSDGLVEGRVPEGGRLGEERLLGVLEGTGALRAGPIEPLIDAVETLNGGPLADDVACLRLSARAPRPGA